MPIDLRAILNSSLRPFAIWLIVVLGVTWAGFPGVACITPLAWLLATRVGLQTVMHSRSVVRGIRITEAGIAGGLFGFLQGVLALIVLTSMEGSGSSGGGQLTEAQLGFACACTSVFAGAAVAVFTAFLFERRRATS